jgi:hypothetical protein
MSMHKKIIHLSDIVLCNGKTIKLEMFSDIPGQSDTHKFPHQRPIPADLSLWRRALCKVSSEFHVLTVPLQGYVGTLHDLPWWMLNNNGSILHNGIVVIENTLRYVHQSQIHMFTRPNLVNNSFLTEWS